MIPQPAPTAADAIESAYPGTVIDKPLRFRDFVANSRACKLYDFDDGRWFTYGEGRRHLAGTRVVADPGPTTDPGPARTAAR